MKFDVRCASKEEYGVDLGHMMSSRYDIRFTNAHEFGTDLTFVFDLLKEDADEFQVNGVYTLEIAKK